MAREDVRRMKTEKKKKREIHFLSNSNLLPQPCHACLGHTEALADISIVSGEVSYMTACLIACHG